SSWSASVLIPAGQSAPPPETLQGILDEVDRLMSTWKPESELSRFNAWVPESEEARFEVSAWTATVVREALVIAEATGGAFDPTVLPLVEAWGFGAGGARGADPTEAELAAAQARCGWENVRVRETALSKSEAGVALDLSAIAPGYAADLICERLRELRLPDHLVDVGGEIRVGGRAEGGRAWRLGVERPADDAEDAQTLQAAIEVQDAALGTSGDYRKFRIGADGRRLSHEIDPRTARPVTHALASATVLAPTGMEADGWATACMILGPDAALAAIEAQPGLEAYLIVRTPDGFRVRTTTGFPSALP
ncbi:MAG: FAD:protein FMN transferase, partial [Planctomycetota bacterium]|nr:FAD:protein FMN transferase [Planctomycetota bacterium]